MDKTKGQEAVAAWFEKFNNTALSRNTPAYNQVQAALPALVSALDDGGEDLSGGVNAWFATVTSTGPIARDEVAYDLLLKGIAQLKPAAKVKGAGLKPTDPPVTKTVINDQK